MSSSNYSSRKCRNIPDSRLAWNEVELNLQSTEPGGVEAIFVKTHEGEEEVNAYYEHAARVLSDRDFGGAPIVLLNISKESALHGTLFSCPE